MSIASDKRGVFNNIKAMNSTSMEGKPPTPTDVMTSVNNAKEVIPFCTDVLKAVVGVAALKMLVGGMLTKMIGGAEPKLKTALKKQFIQSNANDPLPTNTVNIPVKNLDTNGKLKVSPTDTNTGGNILYGQPSANNFDYKAHDAIQLEGTNVSCNNMSIKYNSTTDSFGITPNSSPNISKFFTDYIDTTQLINGDEIVGGTMDRIFGTMSKTQDKTSDQILDELILEKMLEQLLNGDDSFEISPEDLAKLQELANQTADGILSYDMGCGVLPSSLSMDSLQNMMSKISGSKDQFAVSNAIDEALDESLVNTPEVSEANEQTIKDGFFQKMINTLTVKLLTAVTTAPQVRALMGMMSAIQNQGVVLLSSAKEDIKRWKVVIKCMANEILIMVAEFIFALAILYLMKLLRPVIKKLAREMINYFKGIIKSLSGRTAAVATG